MTPEETLRKPNSAELSRHIFDDIRTSLPDDVISQITANPLKGISENIDDIMPPGMAESYRYNLLKRQIETDWDSPGKFESISDTDFSKFALVLKATLAENGLKPIAKDDIRDIYNNLTRCNEVDPWYDYISNIEWDGKPRVREWFIRGLGAEIPSLSPEDSQYLVEEVTQAWFVGAVLRSQRMQKFETVPILMSPKQGIGKSTFVQYTALYGVDESWYASTTRDIDDQQKFFESIAGAKIIEWGEAKQFKRDDAEAMKAFISQEADKYRAPYAPTPTTNPRRWVPIITTNESTLFSDTTGSRRFIPFICNVDKIIDRVYYHEMNTPERRYEVEQVWAEALHMANEGALACISPRAEELAKTPQKLFTKANDFFDELYAILDEEHPEVGDFISNVQLKKYEQELFSLFPEMKVRAITSTHILGHNPGEWVSYTASVKKPSRSTGEMINTTVRGIKRMQKSPRVTYDNLLDAQ
jgi:predicted P-loop ATPase